MSRAYQRNYYRILHVQPDAPLQIIKSSYRTLMQKLKQHPDLGGEHANAALINEAYAVLTDAAKRAAYDQTLTHSRSSPAVLRHQAHTYSQTAHGQCAFCKLPYQLSPMEPEPLCADCASPLLLTKAAQSAPDRKRTEQRVAREQSIVFFTGWPHQPGMQGKIKDLSPRGMLILTDLPLPAGRIIKVCGAALSTVARVVNCRQQAQRAPLVYGIGIEFITLQLRQGRGTFFSADA